MADVTPSTLSLSRRLSFAIVLSVASVVLVLGALELGLRVAHYGYSPRFVRRATSSTGEAIWRENRWTTAPFFSPELVRRPVPFRLPLKKSPGTYRIFVLGSSAAMGDPEPSFSIARVLETMLRAAYPEVRFEVVNAGITAINSHLVRGIAADCAALQPDLFIVYEGNNEVIGPFGPAGVFAPFFRSERLLRTAVWLKGTRTGQLVSALSRKFHGANNQKADWGGMQMFLRSEIAADDPRHVATREHFAANLRAIASAAHDAGASTFLCTILTNQRDFAPFRSQHRPALSADELRRWEALVAAADKAASTNDLAAAEASYLAAWAIDDRYADLAFKLGRLLLQAGRDSDAQSFLNRALDLDTLRFRTDSSLNETIRTVGTSGLPATRMVDLASALGRRSAHQLIGDELLYEHVHLTLRGASDIASELFREVSAELVQRRLISSAAPSHLAYADVRLRLGFTAHEQAMISLELLNRFKGPPFTGQLDHANRLATWERHVASTTALLSRPEATDALATIYRDALLSAPEDWVLARNAGSMLVARKRAADALPLLERAASVIDDDVDTLVALGWAHRALGHSAESDAAFTKARTLEPRYPGLPPAGH